jgi:hypothetical protein
LIVSAPVYDEVIQSRLGDLSPTAFRRIRTKAKGIAYTGYLYRGSFATQDCCLAVS